MAWFQSDNVTGVSPEIWNAMTGADKGEAAPYGDDTLTITWPVGSQLYLKRNALSVQ